MNCAMHLVTYNITEDEKQRLAEGENVDLTNKVSFKEINEDDFKFQYQTESFIYVNPCVSIEIVSSSRYHTYHNNLHAWLWWWRRLW